MHRIIFLFPIIMFFFMSCGDNKDALRQEAKNEADLFIQKWISFNYAIQTNKLNDIFVNDASTTLITLEGEKILKSYKEIFEYFKERFKEYDLVEYNVWDKFMWFDDDVSTAYISFLANRKIKLKNGFTVEFKNIRTSMVLIKDPNKWKLISLHESQKIK